MPPDPSSYHYLWCPPPADEKSCINTACQAPLWVMRPTLWYQLYWHFEYQLKVFLFFYPGQVVPFSESDPTRSSSPSNTTIIDTYFQVYIEQKVEHQLFVMDIKPKAWKGHKRHLFKLSYWYTCKWHLLKALCHDVRAILVHWCLCDTTTPTRLKTRTEFSINGWSSRGRTWSQT